MKAIPEKILYIFYNFQDIMQKNPGTTLESFVVFKVNLNLKKVKNFYRKIQERMLERFVRIKYKVLTFCELL